MVSKRSRKNAAAAARKREAEAAAAAATTSATQTIPQPMQLSTTPMLTDRTNEAALAALPSTGISLHAALYGSGEVGSLEETGERLVSFASSPGLGRLSNEELRLAADKAKEACDIVLERRQYLSIFEHERFTTGGTMPKCTTSAVAAARFAWKSRSDVEGVARNGNEAAEAADNTPGPVWVSTSILEDGSTSYIFHPDTSSMVKHGISATVVEIAQGTLDNIVVDISKLDQVNTVVAGIRTQHDDYYNIDEGLEEYALPPTPQATENRRTGGNVMAPKSTESDSSDSDDVNVDLNLERMGGDLSDNSDSRNVVDGGKNDDEEEEAPGTPSGSIWSSFGRLFNFGRSPENGPRQSEVERGDRNLPPFASPAFVAASPTTPANNTVGGGGRFETMVNHDYLWTHSSASDEEQTNMNQMLFRTIPQRASRRRLKAARTLKQPPSSPSTPDPVVMGVTNLLDETDIGRSSASTVTGTGASAGASVRSADGGNDGNIARANVGKRNKKLPKVKRRPRVRLVEEEEGNR